MKLYTLEREQMVNKALEEVFEFFSRPQNLARITPSGMGFNILTPSPIIMKAGTVIDYTVKIFGFNVHWRTLISSYDPPHGFTDEQLKGPYKYWFHRHYFEKTEGGTLIYDSVTYALPFGYLGRLAHLLFVSHRLEYIFNYRSKAIKEIFEQL
jgi:ligand-binding SRPBCC domain-containing protein